MLLQYLLKISFKQIYWSPRNFSFIFCLALSCDERSRGASKGKVVKRAIPLYSCSSQSLLVMILQRASERPGVPWRNGLGVQYEIACDGSLPDDWTWRVSTADISRNVPFSLYPGVKREFCAADGNGVVLAVNSVDYRCEPCSITTFRGDDCVAATLIDGPIQALNVMLRVGSVSESRSLRIERSGQHAIHAQVIVAILGSASVEIGNQVVELRLLDAIINLSSMDAIIRTGTVAAF
jgi:environmental stress-induced protein Ves